MHLLARRSRTFAFSMVVLFAALVVGLWAVTVRATGAADSAFAEVSASGGTGTGGVDGGAAATAAPAVGKVAGVAPGAAKRSSLGPGHTAASAAASGQSSGATRSIPAPGSPEYPAEIASQQGNPRPTTPPTTSPSNPGPSPTAPPSTGPPSTAPPSTGPPPTSPPPTEAPTTTVPPVQPGARCVVMLHGKGSSGGATYDSGGTQIISPSGNSAAWGGLQWLYFPDSSYASARAIVASAIDAAGCGRVIVDGFSNGGAFAAKLFCRGETFGGRLVGVVADDPVPDHAVEGCAPAGGVKVAVYWTGALDATATPGWNCAEQDWTCQGGSTIGIDAYVRALGTTRKASPYSSHQWYQNAPELTSWW